MILEHSQAKGIRTKALLLIDESQPSACLIYRTMSEKCEGYRKDGASTGSVSSSDSKVEHNEVIGNILKISIYLTSFLDIHLGNVVAGYKFNIPKTKSDNILFGGELAITLRLYFYSHL
jgi:hypothetical protein